MPLSISIMFLFFTMILIIIGVLIKYFKCYWLISGYNTASKDRKARIDIEGLGKLMANFSFIMAGIFGVGAIFAYFNMAIAFMTVILSIFVIIPFILVKAQKYDPITEIDKRRAKTAVIVVIVIMLLSGSLVVGLIIHGNKETKININETTISITGPYSINYLIKDIVSIELKDSMPEVLSKMDGYDMGVTKKGNFNLKGIGGARLYINGPEAPYIYLKKSDKYIIINLKNREDTQDLYFKLKEAVDKSKRA